MIDPNKKIKDYTDEEVDELIEDPTVSEMVKLQLKLERLAKKEDSNIDPEYVAAARDYVNKHLFEYLMLAHPRAVYNESRLRRANESSV